MAEGGARTSSSVGVLKSDCNCRSRWFAGRAIFSFFRQGILGLASPRHAIAIGEVSNFHIDSEPAHTILGQACLDVLLQIQVTVDADVDTPEDHPLARYAAEHWTSHAQFREVSARLQKGIEYLFDLDKPHFKAWLTIYDVDTDPYGSPFSEFNTSRPPSRGTPLYYAALCGFHDLVETLIAKHPQDVNADGGHYMRPILAALTGGYFNAADLLRHNGAVVHIRGLDRKTALQTAAHYGSLEVVQKLIEYGADINARSEYGVTPLHWASFGRCFRGGSVLRFLLKHGADINAQAKNGQTPLHWASCDGALEVVRLLLEHGADIEMKDDAGRTALKEAAGHDDVEKLLREHGAK